MSAERLLDWHEISQPGSVSVDEERNRLEKVLTLLQKERSNLAAQFTRDKHSVLALHNDLNEGVRPLIAEWLRAGMELLTRMHETSARLVEMNASRNAPDSISGPCKSSKATLHTVELALCKG